MARFLRVRAVGVAHRKLLRASLLRAGVVIAVHRLLRAMVLREKAPVVLLPLACVAVSKVKREMLQHRAAVTKLEQEQKHTPCTGGRSKRKSNQTTSSTSCTEADFLQGAEAGKQIMQLQANQGAWQASRRPLSGGHLKLQGRPRDAESGTSPSKGIIHEDAQVRRSSCQS